jgi:hypothetical protein
MILFYPKQKGVCLNKSSLSYRLGHSIYAKLHVYKPSHTMNQATGYARFQVIKSKHRAL